MKKCQTLFSKAALTLILAATSLAYADPTGHGPGLAPQGSVSAPISAER